MAAPHVDGAPRSEEDSPLIGLNMRENLPVFPHALPRLRRGGPSGSAGAAALFPAVRIIEKLRLATIGRALMKASRGRDKPGRPGNAGNVK